MALVAIGLQSDAAVANAQSRPPIPGPPATNTGAPAATPESTDPARAGIKLEYVSATGEGCPAGSYTPKLSEDGRLFSLQLTKMRPYISPEKQAVAASCRLAIVVSAPVNTSFQVDRFTYGGYAYLEEGVTAELTTTYYFQANQAIAEQVQSSLTGPIDRTFTIEDQSNAGLWSPCGVTDRQTLNVQLHIGLRNSTPPRDGTFEVNEAVGIALKWRTCGNQGTPDAGSTAPTADDASTDSLPDAAGPRTSGEDRAADEDSDSDEARRADEDSDSDEARWTDEDSDSDEHHDEDWQDSDEDSDEGGWWWWSSTRKLGVLRWLR